MANQEALKAAQKTIEQQERQQKELRRQLVSNGLAQESTQTNPVVEAKMDALKQIHDQKVRALMKSINNLQNQLESLKAQDKEHRRSALIQNLRKQHREQELLVDVLKQTLVEKAPEFQESRAVVNDFVIKKSVGGPLRFRPKTREELENELMQIDQKYKRAMNSLRQAERETLHSSQPVKSNEVKETPQDDEMDKCHSPSSPPDPALQEEIERLQVELSSKSITINSQADEINQLYAELDRFHLVEDKIERKREKVALLEDKLAAQQLEIVKLVHEKEAQVEKCTQLQEEVEFLRATHVDNVSTNDHERLEQLELIQALRNRELELQMQMEDQQKKWSFDRTAMHQQMRLLEKEKQLLEEEKKSFDTERAALRRQISTNEREKKELELKYEEAEGARAALAANVEELKSLLTKHESTSKEEHEALGKTADEKISLLQLSVEEKQEAIRQLERQLSAAKLLVRQAKKEKEQLQDRLAKLEGDLRAKANI